MERTLDFIFLESLLERFEQESGILKSHSGLLVEILLKRQK